MQVSTFTIPVREVAFKYGTLYVRGVALEDVTMLLRDHLDQLNNIFGLYGLDGDNAPDEAQQTAIVSNAVQFAVNLVVKSPELVASLIFSCTEGLPMEMVRKLPAPVQVDTIRAIFDLTFEEHGGAKKFLGSVLNLVAAMRPASPSEDQPALNT